MSGGLSVRNLHTRYGDFEAVRDVSFEVAEGEVFGLLGPNGAGKTSTVECIIGLRAADAGSISVCGIDAIAQPRQVKEHIGVALQSTALQDKITPREALNLFGSFYQKRHPASALLNRFSLNDKADDSFNALSGGQRQRLALALAFVNDPKVIFLDEPTTGLDPQSRRDLHSAILDLKRDGRTVLLTTHYIEEAHQLCDRIAIVDHGKVIAAGKPDELIASAQTTPRVSVRTGAPLELSRLRSIPGVEHAEVEGNTARITTAQISQTVTELFRLLESQGIELLDLHIHRPSLEDVFIELTGEEVRDQPNARA